MMSKSHTDSALCEDVHVHLLAKNTGESQAFGHQYLVAGSKWVAFR